MERLQWEATTSNNKVEKLQKDLNAFQGEMSSYTLLFESLSNDNYTLSDQEYDDITPDDTHLPEIVSKMLFHAIYTFFTIFFFLYF